MPTKIGDAMSVNPTKKTPAPVAGGRGVRGRGGRGRRIELPILDHAAVGKVYVEPLTCSPSSSPQVSLKRINERHEDNGVKTLYIIVVL